MTSDANSDHVSSNTVLPNRLMLRLQMQMLVLLMLILVQSTFNANTTDSKYINGNFITVTTSSTMLILL